MTTTAAPARAAYRDLNVLRWTAGLVLSLLGDQVFFIALGLLPAPGSAGPTGRGFPVAQPAVKKK